MNSVMPLFLAAVHWLALCVFLHRSATVTWCYRCPRLCAGGPIWWGPTFVWWDMSLTAATLGSRSPCQLLPPDECGPCWQGGMCAAGQAGGGEVCCGWWGRGTRKTTAWWGYCLAEEIHVMFTAGYYMYQGFDIYEKCWQESQIIACSTQVSQW